MEKKETKTLIIIFLIIGGIVLFGLGFIIGGESKKTTICGPNTVNGQDTRVIPELCESLMPPEPEDIFAQSGNVIDIENNQITISTENIEDYKIVQKDIVVKIDENTKIVEFDPTLPPPEPTEDGEGNIFEPEEVEIKIGKIKKGNLINANAAENIKGQTEFVAEKITLIVEPDFPEEPQP